ncbi:YdeI/OmpD-associated family protein [Dyadobacter psychrotolerans]|uniref:DUF1905 domain-containing protein n=1 Tax=Dyadobacter psychrotolerans TaxID=2541721 RepID=A0A4R5D4P5_9BACT|nr:YdeI/OmpD-associated family protein [Dyadobacter psychrotolerans]TDE08389.1 DUF1905 domain-containing protein [Dyadobacter psychrotolerans]
MENAVSFHSVLERFAKKGGEFYMIVPDEVARQFVTGRKPGRVRCRLNDQIDFQCAIRPMATGAFYINLANEIRKKAKIVLSDKLSATVVKDDSEYGRDMPIELTELLEQDPEGFELFQNLLASHQRGIIHYVDSAKSVQLRIDRAVKMINRLKI